jgi:hypothetical protein
MCAGTAAGIGVIYMTSEWKGKDLLQYIPVYNRKINFSPCKKCTFELVKEKLRHVSVLGVANMDTGSGVFLTRGPGSGIRYKYFPDLEYRMQPIISESLITIFLV